MPQRGVRSTTCTFGLHRWRTGLSEVPRHEHTSGSLCHWSEPRLLQQTTCLLPSRTTRGEGPLVVRGDRGSRWRQSLPQAVRCRCVHNWHMGARRSTLADPTVAAVPAYFATMAAEAWYLRCRRGDAGPSSGDYEARDTAASLSMGVGSLLVPLIAPRVLRPFTPGRGRWGTALLAAAIGAASVTSVADVLARRAARRSATGRPSPVDPGSWGVQSRRRGTSPRRSPLRAVSHRSHWVAWR